ncbi:MAG: transposase [Ruminococcus sp.]
MPKSKHSPEFRAKVSQEYLDGIGSIQFLADKYSIGYSTLKGWINEYQIHGIAAFCHPSNRNRTYSKEFKLRCVEAVLMEKGLLTISSLNMQYLVVLFCEVGLQVYNANREFKDYNPKREVYMAEARRKQHLRNEKKSLIIASTIIVTIRIQLQNSMFLTVRSILG